MANYYESARTNYFRVKDDDKFKEFIKAFDACINIVSDAEGRVALLFDYDLGVPTSREIPDETDNEGEEYPDGFEDVDFMQELSEHLAEGSVAILVSSGAEKLRYVTGWAQAINSKGKSVNINIDTIYELSKILGGEVTRAEY